MCNVDDRFLNKARGVAPRPLFLETVRRARLAAAPFVNTGAAISFYFILLIKGNHPRRCRLVAPTFAAFGSLSAVAVCVSERAGARPNVIALAAPARV